MNHSNQTAGAIVFLIWSLLCSWHYACHIKGQCARTIATAEIIPTSLPSPIEAPEPKAEITEEDIEPEEIVSSTLEPISIVDEEFYFQFDSDQVANSPGVEEFINNLKTQIKGRKVAISIVGSTCDLGRAEYNQKLGLERARAFKDILDLNGVSAEWFDVSSIGEIASVTGTQAEREKNRKVTITIKSLDS